MNAWLRRQVQGPGQGTARPDIAKPQVRQQMQGSSTGTAVERLDTDAVIFRRGLGILNHDVEIAVLIENAGVEQLELEALSITATVLGDQPGIGKFALRI